MSRLKHAPLVEVVFEFRWDFEGETQTEQDEYLFLLGDLYHKLQDRHPVRENIISFGLPIEVFVNNPQVRFRPSLNGYPLVQFGPGFLSYNMTDEVYYSDAMKTGIQQVLNALVELKNDIGSKLKGLSLKYYDFYPQERITAGLKSFIEEKLHTSIAQPYMPQQATLKQITARFDYEVREGSLSISFATGFFKEKAGLFVVTGFESKPNISQGADVSDWLNLAHSYCSETFRNMTKGELYESFSAETN